MAGLSHSPMAGLSQHTKTMASNLPSAAWHLTPPRSHFLLAPRSTTAPKSGVLTAAFPEAEPEGIFGNTKKDLSAQFEAERERQDNQFDAGDMERWRNAWRELWEAERVYERESLQKQIKEANERIRELQEAAVRSENNRKVWEDEKRNFGADALEAARIVAEREEACRSAVKSVRRELEASEIRAATADARAAAAMERAAAAEDARALCETAWSSKFAALRDEAGLLRDELAAAKRANGERDDERDALLRAGQRSEAECRQQKHELAQLAEVKRVLDVDLSRARAQLANVDSELASREAFVAQLSGEMRRLRSTGGAGAAASAADEELAVGIGSSEARINDFLAHVHGGTHGEMAREEARLLAAAMAERSLDVGILAAELSRLDDERSANEAKLKSAQASLDASQLEGDALWARADAAEAALHACERNASELKALAEGTRSELTAVEARKNALEVSLRERERKFAEALQAIQTSAEKQLAVQAERFHKWEGLADIAGLPDAATMGAHACIELIRGRRTLRELSELIRAERDLQLEQGRLVAMAMKG